MENPTSQYPEVTFEASPPAFPPFPGALNPANSVSDRGDILAKANLIAAEILGDEQTDQFFTEEMLKGKIKASVAHLEQLVAKEYWDGEDLSLLQNAIATGKQKLS